MNLQTPNKEIEDINEDNLETNYEREVIKFGSQL